MGAEDQSDISALIERLTAEVNQIACEKTRSIQKITNQMKMLALNALIESSRAGAQGAVGVRDDGIAAVSPWGFELTDIRVPVSVWQGRQDAMVPVAHGQWLAAHVPGARAHLLDDEGHVSLFARLDDILADLKALAGL